MKTVFFSLQLLLYSVSVFGQELQTDSTTGKLIYRGVVKVDSADAGKLYDLCAQWVARAYRSADAVIQYGDKAAGQIIAKGNWPSALNLGDFWEHTLVMEMKDGRMRYTFTDFVRYTPTGTLAGRTPLESIKFMKNSFREYFAKEADKTAKSLEKYLLNPSAKKDDGW